MQTRLLAVASLLAVLAVSAETAKASSPACGLKPAAIPAAVPATVFPKKGWTDVKIERHPDAVTVVAGGDWMRLAPYPNKPEYVKALVVSNTEDALVIDAQKMFRLGAGVLFLTGGGIDPKPFHGREATVVTEWSGAYGTRVTPFIEGADTEGHHWYRHGSCDVTPRRRTFRMTHRIDENVAHLHWRLDINDAQKSPICFYRATFGEPSEFALSKQILPPQELLFHASFDNGCTADFAKGKREPTVLRNIPLVPGRRGQAVRFSREAKGVLGYSAPGNIRPDCGTMSFWFKREWKEKKFGIIDGGVFRQNDYWRTIFKLQDRNAIACDGGISFWWWGPTLRTDRGDLDNRCQCNPTAERMARGRLCVLSRTRGGGAFYHLQYRKDTKLHQRYVSRDEAPAYPYGGFNATSRYDKVNATPRFAGSRIHLVLSPRIAAPYEFRSYVR